MPFYRDHSAAEQLIKLSKSDLNLDLFSSLLFRYSSEEDLELYTKADLKKAAQLAGEALFYHKKGDPTLSVVNDGVKKGEDSLCVITIINENKPFLLDSLLNLMHLQDIKLEFLAHPIFTVKGEEGGYQLSLVQECASCQSKQDKEPTLPASTTRRLSIIQFHVPNLTEEGKEQLTQKIYEVLHQVYAAVEDSASMLACMKDTSLSYKRAAQSCADLDVLTNQVESLFEWLTNDNFTFFGMCRYRYDPTISGAFALEDKQYGLLKSGDFHLTPHADMKTLAQEPANLLLKDGFVRVRKVNIRSLVHRFVFLDAIDILLFNEQGEVCGVLSILGIFAASAYTCSIFTIPYLRTKIEEAIRQLGICLEDYSGKVLIDLLETYPRDELFQTGTEDLVENLRLLLESSARPKVRALTYFDEQAGFVSALVYLPRDLYDTDNFKKIGLHLLKIYNGDHYDGDPRFVSHSLARIHYVIHRQAEAGAPVFYPREMLEKDITLLIKGWREALEAEAKEQKYDAAFVKLAQGFPSYYQERFSAKDALEDARYIQSLVEGRSLIVNFYRQRRYNKDRLGIKIFAREEMPLSARIPLLENMGFRAVSERSYGLPDGQGGRVFFHDMRLEKAHENDTDIIAINEVLSRAFVAIWSQDADNDAFNALVQTAKITWEEIVVLRAYGRYLQQAGIPYDQDRLAKALNTHPDIASMLYRLFALKFDPKQSHYDRAINEQELQAEIERALQNVPNLDDDIILRRFRNLIGASLRTNAFLPEKDGSHRRILAIKLNPCEVEGLPEPRPFREIFVYGPEVEGVHLRFGKVARGGIRWSDRALDYRTEILGLVKAQQVKNTVIVPVGSKGGFYPHRLPENGERSEIQEAGRQAYILYISAMLSITDNLTNGEIVSPPHLICYDEKDPYFVVAADKGTATFSDTANAISQENMFWLDDAFASGGSDGYDHKAIGITAKGAWEAVKRHFRELMERDISKESFTVVGVGDMSGDVFGNGLLLSRHARLIAAFDHRDIFIDPNPDAEISYKERERLFNLPRSSWQDYDRSKLSPGGEVYSRSQKVIHLSPEAAKAIAFDKQSGTPYEIINAILKADVDLLWFGGIGTYVCAQTETDAEVGDRSNDILRVTGKDVRAKIVGEGANLAMTQRGRIEYCLNGGRCDTDAIDNSAGVNCSDVEVNIKIALADAMRQNKISRENRNQLLKSMVNEVERLVLRNNYLQPLALSLAEEEGCKALPYQIRYMQDLERRNLLDRKIELLPSDTELRDRRGAGYGLTRPELSVLLAYAKLDLEQLLSHSDLVKDPYFYESLLAYFPIEMRHDFEKEIANHQLRDDIIATNLANDIVNRGGATFVSQLQDKTGATVEECLIAYVTVRDGLGIKKLYDAVDSLDNVVAGRVQNQLYADIGKLLFEATNSALRTKIDPTNIQEKVSQIENIFALISKNCEDILPANLIAQFEEKAQNYQAIGIETDLARAIALASICINVPHIAAIMEMVKADPSNLVDIYFALEQKLGISIMEAASQNIAIIDYYDSLALAQANGKIATSLQQLVIHIYNKYGRDQDPVEAWLREGGEGLEGFMTRLYALLQRDLNISRFIVAASMLEDVVQKQS